LALLAEESVLVFGRINIFRLVVSVMHAPPAPGGIF